MYIVGQTTQALCHRHHMIMHNLQMKYDAWKQSLYYKVDVLLRAILLLKGQKYFFLRNFTDGCYIISDNKIF